MLKKVTNDQIALTPAEADLFLLYNRIHARKVLVTPENNGAAQQIEESSDDDQVNNLHATKRTRRPGPRQKERLEASRNALMNWRHKTWKAAYTDCIWGPDVLLPDPILTKIATRARIQTISDIKNEMPEWIWVDEYGEAVLKLLEPIDQSWREEIEQKKAENKAKRAKTSAEKKAIRDEERLAKARESTAQRRIASTSRQALRQVYPVPVPPTAHYPIQQYPHPIIPMQFAMAYPALGYPPLSFIPYHPPSNG